MDNCTASSITAINDDFEALETFKLIDAGLTTLKGFPKLINLKKVDLSSNCLNGGLENLVGCENIEYLDLKGNKIQCLEQLEPLTKLPNLTSLELLNCEISTIENYREQIFGLLPNLKYLDGLDRDGQECEIINGASNDEVCTEAQNENEDETDSDEEEDGNETHEVGLSYLAKEDLGDEEDDEDFDAEKVADATANSTADEEEDDIDEEEIKAISEGVEIDENSNSRSGLKRKFEESND